MSRRTRRARTGAMLELWRPPERAGEPIGCLATTYTFHPGLFDEHCLGRFLEIESEPNRESLAFVSERESRLGGAYAGVLVDYTQAGVEHSLRWDVLPVRVSGKQHAKLSLLAWSRCIRIIVASANLTEPGYRRNREVAATVDLSPEEADRDLLMQAIAFLRDLLAFVPGAQDDTPEVGRASDYLSQVERQAETWERPRRKTVVRQQLACTLPAVPSGSGPRSSLDETVEACRRGGRSPNEAWVASPFFDVDDDSARVVAALCKSMARGLTRKIRFCVPAVRDEGETDVSRLAAPHAITRIPLQYRGSVSVAVLPDFDDEENPRCWHAKMLALRGDGYTALLVGSSNFTCAGMGAAPYRNAEANLLTIVDRVEFGRKAGALEEIWSEMEPVVDPDASEWLGSRPEADEEAGSVVSSLPAGFVSGTYRAGNDREIVLRFDSARLPTEWRIHACGQDRRELLTESAWAERGSRSVVALPWSPAQPPDRLLVVWDGEEAFMPLNVENERQLQAPEVLAQLSADDILAILAAADSSTAIRNRVGDRQPSDGFDADLDSATPIDLDPLRRHDLQATFLRRVRRRARVLARLREKLERPVWGWGALNWRLRGMIGIEALADRRAMEISTSAGNADEALLTLADLLIVLHEVDYEPSDGALSKQEFDDEFRPFLRELAAKLGKQVAAHESNISPEPMRFWRRVLYRCR